MYAVFLFVVVFIIFLLIIIVKGYNKLARLLNQVSIHKSKVVTTLARRGIAVNDLQHLATIAGEHEEKTQVGVATERGTKSPFMLGAFTIETPPDLKAISAFLSVQEKLDTFEKEFLTNWEEWTFAAREYDDSRSTFPLILVAWISNRIKSERFPYVLTSQAENEYNPRNS